MKLVEMLSNTFDSFSFRINDLMGVGYLTDVSWYVFIHTPYTFERVNFLFNNDLITCPREKNLFIKSEYELYQDTLISVCDEDITGLREDLLDFCPRNNTYSLEPEQCIRHLDFYIDWVSCVDSTTILIP